MFKKVKFQIKGIDRKSLIFYISVLLLAAAAVIAGILTNGETIRNVLFEHDDVFMDFFNSVNNNGFGYDAYNDLGVIYPPLTVLFYKGISFLFTEKLASQAIKASSLGMIVFTIYTIACISLLIKCIKKYKIGNKLDKLFFTVSIFASVPMIFLLERGNILILVISLLLIYAYGYDSENAITRHIAFICLAIAVSIKIYPVIFGLLLLKKKKNFKNIAWCVFYGALFFFVPFFFVGGFSQFFVLMKNIFYTSSMFGNKGYGFKVNITNTFGMFGELFNHKYIFESIGNTVFIVTVIVGILLILFGKFDSEWKIFAVLSLFLIVVPGFSYVYSVTYMIIPLIMFLNKKETNRLDFVYLILFILQFGFFIAVKKEMFEIFSDSDLSLNIATFIESLSLLVMLCILYVDGIVTTYKSFKGKKVLFVPLKAMVSAGLIVVFVFCGVFSIYYYTPSKSGFSITSLDCFTVDDDSKKDQKTLENFYSFASDKLTDKKVLAFPRVDITSKLSENLKNVSYYDIAYYKDNIKTSKGLEKYNADYMIIYNVMKTDIEECGKEIAHNEKNKYLSMLRDMTKYCWQKGYKEVKTFTINKDIEIQIWQRQPKNKRTWRNGGKGTKENPYTISTASQLNDFSKYVNAGAKFKGKYIVLTNDIDMSGIDDFLPIGYERNNNYFSGIFDGRGYSIKNLKIQAKSYKNKDDYEAKNNVALFGRLCGKVINLTVENSKFKGYCVAVFARNSNSNSAIVNCLSKNNTLIGTRCSETADDYIGTMVGVVALGNKCKAEVYSNIVSDTVLMNSKIISCYTNTKHYSDNNYFMNEKLLKNQDVIDTLNEDASQYNYNLRLEYTTKIHKLCYIYGVDKKDIKDEDPDLNLCNWVIKGGKITLAYVK